MDSRIGETIKWFNEIYIEGIPLLIRDKSAFLSFVCSLTAIEALSGYRYGKGTLKTRFTAFIQEYFPNPYPSLTKDLWIFRNRMIHAFCPASFALIHNQPHAHLQQTADGYVVLNAENFYADVRSAAMKYVGELNADVTRQQTMLERLNDFENAGTIGVGSIAIRSQAAPSAVTRSEAPFHKLETL